MPADFELLSPTDKPALLAIGNPDSLATCKFVLNDLGYKIHVAANHEDFLTRFSQVQYQVVVIEELFATSVPAENSTLQSVKAMPMAQRRHAVFFLLGETFQSLNPMQAFQQSVHGVVNRSDLGRLSQILQQIIADNSLFLNVYREAQLRAAQGKS
jgi:hypothetical protein